MARLAQRVTREGLGPRVERQFYECQPMAPFHPLNSLTMHHGGYGGWRSRIESTGVVSATQVYTVTSSKVKDPSC